MAKGRRPNPISNNRVMTLGDDPTHEELLRALDMDEAMLESRELGPFLLVLKACEADPEPHKVEFTLNNPQFCLHQFSKVFADDRTAAWKELFAVVAGSIRKHISVDAKSLKPERIAIIQEFANLQISLHLVIERIKQDNPKRGVQPLLSSYATENDLEVSEAAIQQHLAAAAARKFDERQPPGGDSRNSRHPDNSPKSAIFRPMLTPQDYNAKPSALSNKLNTLLLIFYIAALVLIGKRPKDLQEITSNQLADSLSMYELKQPADALVAQLIRARDSVQKERQDKSASRTK